jgi:hypothetical protein
MIKVRALKNIVTDGYPDYPHQRMLHTGQIGEIPDSGDRVKTLLGVRAIQILNGDGTVQQPEPEAEVHVPGQGQPPKEAGPAAVKGRTQPQKKPEPKKKEE